MRWDREAWLQAMRDNNSYWTLGISFLFSVALAAGLSRLSWIGWAASSAIAFTLFVSVASLTACLALKRYLGWKPKY